MRFTRHRQQLDQYYPLDWRCIFPLITRVDESRTMKEALGMNYSESWRAFMDEGTLKKITRDLVPLPNGQ